MALSVDIEKKIGKFLLKVKFDASNEVLALLGASGCGKSMTLKCIAGIEKPDKGKIVLNGVTLFDSQKKINVSPQKRKVGYLFQQYALFPNMTVEENIACGVRNKDRKKEIIVNIIETMELCGMEKKKPYQLSGGQQQRVALARILVSEPEVLLLDEPFSALDSHLKFQLERQVQKIIKKFGKTVVFVSHERDEVFRLTDSIAIMKDGHLETIGNKRNVFGNPETKTGAILTGCKNISRIQHLGNDIVYANDWGIELSIPGVNEGVRFIGIHLHDLKIAESNSPNTVLCEILEVVENPFSYTVMLQPMKRKNGQFSLEMDKKEWNRYKGEMVTVCFSTESLLLLKE